MHLLSPPLNLLICLILTHGLSFCYANEQNETTNNATSFPQQLANAYQEDIDVKHYWISEKLDGIRARWNGAMLVTRNNNMIHTPSWFVKNFPSQTLDGELWLARNSFEQTASIVLRDTPGEEWHNIKFMLFDLPEHKGTFSQRITAMQELVDSIASPNLQVIPQFKLKNHAQLLAKLAESTALGAEGLMLHHAEAYYEDGRSANLLKLKKHQDAEAVVLAHLPGKGKYKGLLGSILVELDSGLQFKIGSGFSDMQRQHPPPVGTIITFKYFGLTAKGIPRFASFLRIKPVEVSSE